MLLDAEGTFRRPSPVVLDGPPSFAGDASAALARYAARGYHVEPSLLTADECRELRDAADALGDDGRPPLAPVMNPHRASDAFRRAMAHPAIVVIVERLLGHPVSGLQSQYFPCVPGTPGFTTHQDNHYVEAERDAFASAWIALDHASAENGALVVHPGSQREPLLPVEDVPGAVPQPTQAFNAIRQRVVVPDGYTPRTIDVPRGAGIFLHGHLLHGSHPNRARRARPALLLTYVRRGARFRRGASAERSEIDVYASRGRS